MLSIGPEVWLMLRLRVDAGQTPTGHRRARQPPFRASGWRMGEKGANVGLGKPGGTQRIEHGRQRPAFGRAIPRGGRDGRRG